MLRPMIKRRNLLAALIGTGALAAVPARADSDLAAQLDGLVAPHFPAGQPGAAVLVRKGEQILLRKAYGKADMASGLPSVRSRSSGWAR
jgi:CubicO group peptidase (beta-lactamase class C family)